MSSERWRLVPLGEVATLDIEKVHVAAGTTYQIAGVLNAGKGMLRRDPIDGAETSYPALHRLRAGQLVMRKLTAWEGPITIVPEDYDGFVVSTEFPTFSLNADELLPQFMRLVCMQPSFWERMQDRSTGSVQRRKRVSPTQLLSIDILLPPLAMQRRIVDLMQKVDEYFRAASEVGVSAAEAGRGLVEHRLRSESPHWEVTNLNEIGQQGLFRDGDWVESKDQDPSGEVRLLQLADIGTGAFLDRSDRWMRLDQADRLRCTHLHEGDVLVARMPDPIARACVVPPGLPTSVTAVDVSIVRPPAGILPAFLVLVLNSGGFRRAASALQTGSTRPRISRKNLGTIPIPIPQEDVQIELVETAGAISTYSRLADGLAYRVDGLRSALLASLLSGQHEIPASYDELLERAS